jgi:hypothetical protein
MVEEHGQKPNPIRVLHFIIQFQKEIGKRNEIKNSPNFLINPRVRNPISGSIFAVNDLTLLLK